MQKGRVTLCPFARNKTAWQLLMQRMFHHAVYCLFCNRQKISVAVNRTGEEFGHRIDQRLCIRCAGCLKSGVHCQLGQADIYGVQTEMSVYEVAEGGAAADIGLVGEFLERCICPAADFLEYRRAYRIRAVQLCTTDTQSLIDAMTEFFSSSIHRDGNLLTIA